MQKSTCFLLSLLVIACSYHAEVSCMDALVTENQTTEETALLASGELRERVSTQALTKQLTKDHKKSSRCCDSPCCKGCYQITLYSAIGVVCLSSVGLLTYVIYLATQQ